MRAQDADRAGGTGPGAPRTAHPEDGRAPVPWRVAWQRAAMTFYGAPSGIPARHFRTTAMLDRVLADAIAVLVDDVDARLGRPPVLDVVDVGAGDGELLSALADLVDPGRIRLTGVDLRARPAALPRRVRWVRGGAPEILASEWPDGVVGLVMAHEWLDDVPCDVVAYDEDGSLRLVLVDSSGAESLGPLLEDRDGCEAVGVDGGAVEEWVQRYVGGEPVPGSRIEVGLSRDVALRSLVRSVGIGTVLAVDYTAAPGTTTLLGWRDGSPVSPVPDSSMNVTAHVVVESCVAAVAEDPRALGIDVRTQRQALARCGIAPAGLPSKSGVDEATYLRDLVRANAVAVAADPSGLGRYHWIRVDI